MTTIVHLATIPESLHFLRGQVRYLRSRGWCVHAIASPGPALEAFGKSEQIPVHSVPMTRRISPITDLGSLRRLRKLLGSLRPEIVHAHTPKAGLLGMLAAAQLKVPVRIYHLHGLPLMTARVPKRWLLAAVERIAIACSHQVLCVSRSLAEVVAGQGLAPVEKLAILEGGSVNGVDTAERFHPERVTRAQVESVRRRQNIPDSAPVIGFVGRLVRDKGVHELVAAWEILRDEFPDARLLVLGESEHRDAVASEIRQHLTSDPRVHLAGWIDDVAPYYAAMDVLAFPSHREGFGCVAIEAGAMERPVVASDIPGCRDSVLDGVTGTLVPCGDTRQLADALRKYLVNPDLRRRHGIAGRQRAVSEFQPLDLWEANHHNYVRWVTERGLAAPQDAAHRRSLRGAA